MIGGSPRHPFELHNSDVVEVDGHEITVLYGEMSSPAIAMSAEWTFEIKESELVRLDRARK